MPTAPTSRQRGCCHRISGVSDGLQARGDGVKNTMSASEIRDDFANVLNRVSFGSERVVVTRNGKNVAALVSMEDFAIIEQLIGRTEDRLDIAAAAKALRSPTIHRIVLDDDGRSLTCLTHGTKVNRTRDEPFPKCPCEVEQL